MESVTIWPFTSFEVVVVSDEFMDILKDLPEVSTCSQVQIGDKIIKGPETIFVARSMEEIENNFSSIVAKLIDPKHTHIRIIERGTTCRLCQKAQKRHPEKVIIACSHGNPVVNKAYDIDVKKLLKKKRA